ncbi:hypothetical protein Q8A73_018703 [Channa argus]|nr:hypothetical protein Q8A73_018703 [Channa argus]
MPGAFTTYTLTALLLSVTWADHHQNEAELSCLKLSPFNADFAFALYKRLNAQTAAGQNTFFSPLGISTALSMLSAGASGETHSQLFSTLGYSTLNQTQVNKAYENLLHMLGQSHENEQLKVGNAVALRSNFSPKENYLTAVRSHFSSEIFQVDLSKPDNAAAEINKFVANKTHDKIKDAVKDIDPDMAMMLINYVYFKGEWATRFSSELTHKADFHVNATATVQVDMMQNNDVYQIYQDAENHTTVIQLPYKGNTFMMIVLPDEGKMEEVEGYISRDYIWHWHKSVNESLKASRRTLVAAKMPGAFAVSTLTALLLSVTWADHHQHPLPHIEAELNCLKLSPFNADFAFALYKRLNAQTAAGHNIFFSPLGISTALSMLSAGASGETHSQLFSTLGYSTLNQTQVNNAYENLLHSLGQSHELEQLNVGNAVALRSNFSPLEKFLKVVRHYYSAEIFKVDLNKPDEAAAEINTFISNKTHDKIKDAVKEIDPDMVMLLINYVYFKAEWKKPFNRDLTTKADFNVNTATKVQVDMMMDTDFYDIYMDAVNHTTVIKLPYKGNTSMMIVLPDEGKMEEVEGFISKDHMRHWHNSLSKHHVDLYLPKFSISTEASLKETLQEMGITDAFGDQADFSGVSDTDRMKVSQVTHNAALSVTEMGTEAAAATIVTGVATSLPLTLKVDRPFLVCIWDHSIRSLLFMGKINNPTAM